MKKKIKLTCSIIFLIGGGVTFMDMNQEEQLLDKVIVSVDDQPIFYTDLEAEYQFHQAQGEQTLTKIQILENMVVNNIFLARAAQQNIHIKKEEIERNLQDRMATIIQQVGTESNLEQYLEKNLGKSISTFQDELRKSIKEQLTLDHMIHLVVDDITVSPQEVKSFFENLPPSQRPFYPTKVEVYHLVRVLHDLPVGRQVLEDVRASLQAGESFPTLAKKYSEDKATAPGGGELGFWKIGQLDLAYEKAALSLNPGEVSEIVETRFGLHLIQLIERNKDQYNSRHILIKRGTTKQDPTVVIEELDHIRTNIIEQKISFEKAVAAYSEDVSTRKRGGILTNGAEPYLYLVADELSSEMVTLLDQMNPGSISVPHLFTTSTGELAARIIYLKKKVHAHIANLEQDYAQIHQLALNAKKQQALDKFIATAKEKILVQFDPIYETSRELNKQYANQ